MRALAVFVALAGCGRVGFGDVGGLGDAIDATPDAPRTCAIDSDCSRCERCEASLCQAEPINQLVLGHTMMCYLGAGSTRWCTGQNDTGELGLGSTDVISRPTRNVGEFGWDALYLGGGGEGLSGTEIWAFDGPNYLPTMSQPAAGIADIQTQSSDCIEYTDHTVSCDPTATVWQQFAMGWYLLQCGIQAPGTLWCWGTSIANDLGQGEVTDGTVFTNPTQVGTDTDWAEVDAGDGFACARKTNGTMWCWGNQNNCGTNFVDNHGVPLQINSDTDWTFIQVRWTRACGGKPNHDVYCWGGATMNDPINPGGDGPGIYRIGNFDDWRTGGHHECGLSGGQWSCFGANDNGQLGIGTTDPVTDFVPLCGP